MTDAKADKKAFWALVKVIFKGEDRAAAGIDLGKKGKKPSRVTKYILYGLLLVSFGMLAALLGHQGYAMGRAGVALSLIYRAGLMIQVIFGLLFGIFGVVSYMYFPKDLPVYLALPYTGKQVMAAKFLHFFLLNLIGTVLFLPLLIAGLIGAAAPAQHYVTGILGYLAGSIGIDIFLTAVTILLMRFSAIARNKDRFTTIFSTFTILIAIAFAVGIQFMNDPYAAEPNMGLETLGQIGGPWDIALGILCPPILFGSWLFSDSAVRMLGGVMLSLLTVALYTVIMLQLGERYYFDGVMAVQAAGGKRSHKKFGDAELAAALQPKRSMAARYAGQQLLKLRRNPTFFTQLMLQPLLMPLMMVGIIAAILFMSLRKEAGVPLGELFALIRGFTETLSFDSEFMLLGVLGFAVWIVIGTMSDTLTFRMAISSDGADFFYFKQLPGGLTSYLAGMQRAYLPLSLIPHLVLVALVLLLLQLPLVNTLYLLLNSLVLAYSAAMVYMVYGAVSPKFDWDNEIQLLKGDPKLALLMYSGFLIGLLVAGPQGLLIWLNYRHGFMGNTALLILTLLFNLSVAAALTAVYYGPAKRKLARVEP